MSSSETLTRFFEGIWKDTEGWVYLPYRESPEKDSFKKIFFEWPAKKSTIVKYVEFHVAQKHEVYFGPAIYKTPTAASNNNIVGTHVLWADFDSGTAPENWAQMSSIISEPSVKVQTSAKGNEHVYWALSELQTDLDWVEAKNKSIAYTLDSDKACWNANRILRPPGTINFGYAKPEREGKTYPVLFSEFSDRVYGEEHFAHLKGVRPAIRDNLVAGDTPSVDDIKMDCLWTPELKELFRKTKEEVGKDRSGALVSLAMQGAELGWTNQQIFALVCDADDRWEKYKGRTDSDFQRSGVVEYARRKHPYSKDDVSFAGLVDADTEINPQIAYGYRDFMALDTKIEWSFEGLLSAKGYGIIMGPSGAGKTQLGSQLARCAALGRDFLEWKYAGDKPKKVLFFSLEMAAEELIYFFEFMDKPLSDEDRTMLQENFIIIPMGTAMSLNVEATREFFETQIEEHKPDIIFIDSLGTMTTGALNDDGPAREMLTYIQKIRQKYKTAFYVIHHANKANAGPDLALGDFYGNTYLFTGVDFVLGLALINQQDSRNLRLSKCKLRLTGGRDSLDIVRTEYLSFEVEGGMDDLAFGAIAPGSSPEIGFGGIEL